MDYCTFYAFLLALLGTNLLQLNNNKEKKTKKALASIHSSVQSSLPCRTLRYMLKTAMSKGVKLLRQTETSVYSFIHLSKIRLRRELGLRITPEEMVRSVSGQMAPAKTAVKSPTKKRQEQGSRELAEGSSIRNNKTTAKNSGLVKAYSL